MKKLISLLLAVLLVCSITIPAWAAPVEEAIIDTTRTGSINIYKYDPRTPKRTAFGTVPMYPPASGTRTAWRRFSAIPSAFPT